MTDRTCFDCMYSRNWDIHDLGECYKWRYWSFVRANGVCRWHRYDEEDEGMSELEISELPCLHSL